MKNRSNLPNMYLVFHVYIQRTVVFYVIVDFYFVTGTIADIQYLSKLEAVLYEVTMESVLSE